MPLSQTDLPDFDKMLSWVFGIVGLAGVLLTIHYGRKSARLEREKVTLTWTDLRIAVDDIAKEITNSSFVPDLIFALSGRGSIVAHLLSQELETEVPVLVGVTLWKESNAKPMDLPHHEFITTSKWYLGVPAALFEKATQRLLIVDDFAMTGDALERIRNLLMSKGYPSDNLRTVTVVATEVAVRSKKGPNFFWRSTESTQFFFPWGRAK